GAPERPRARDAAGALLVWAFVVAGRRRRVRVRRRRLRDQALSRPGARRADLHPAATRADGAGEPGMSAGRFIAVGAGRGGVGKSLVAVNLAVYLAQLGKTVVLVDADAGGSNLHAHLGLAAGRREPDVSRRGAEVLRSALVSTSVPGLWLLPAAHDAVTPALTLRAGRKSRWLAALRALDAEYLVVDVGPGHGDFALDLMLAADVPIAVTV